ncbi:MAG: hypothetical protein QM490_01790 [Candidatus Gracilibacteria bacterium]
MRLIISILIAGIFTLFGLLKFKGYFELGKVNLINMDGTFEVNFSSIKQITDYIFYIPQLIFDSEKESLKEYFSRYTSLSNQDIYISIVFLFHFIFIFSLTQFLKIFAGYTDKKYFAIGIVIMYFLSIYFVRYYVNL